MNYLILFSLFSIVFSSQPRTSRPVVGGWREASPTSESVRRVAGNAMSKLGENDISEIVTICEAKTQLVAGVNYDISMIIKSKGSSNDLTNRYCKFRAYEKSWENVFEVEELSCDKNQKYCPKAEESK